MTPMQERAAKVADPLDICVCGDYRRSHVDGTGRCNLNDLGHGCGPGVTCEKFRLHEAAK